MESIKKGEWVTQWRIIYIYIYIYIYKLLVHINSYRQMLRDNKEIAMN